MGVLARLHMRLKKLIVERNAGHGKDDTGLHFNNRIPYHKNHIQKNLHVHAKSHTKRKQKT